MLEWQTLWFGIAVFWSGALPPVEMASSNRGDGSARSSWGHHTAALLSCSPLGLAQQPLLATLLLADASLYLSVPNITGLLAMTRPIAMSIGSATGLNRVVDGRLMIAGEQPPTFWPNALLHW